MPFDCYKIGRIASGKESKFLTNAVTTDPRVHNNQWAAELGLVSFGGYRLYDTDGETIGVMALFADYEIDFQVDDFLSGLAHTVSQVIIAKQAEYRLRESEKRHEEANREISEMANKISDIMISVVSQRGRSGCLQFENPDMVNCRQIKNCIKTDCPAYSASEPTRCWEIAGTFCRGQVQGHFAKKIGDCRLCEVYQQARCNPIYNLAEAFNTMRAVLTERQMELVKAKETALSMMEDTEKAKHEIETINEDLMCETVRANEMAAQAKHASIAKSQFLANMSHELRTPLNSLLILAQDLQANHQKNLMDDQVECAGIIYNSGKDLLDLINDILDLAKVESGKMSLTIESVALTEIAEGIHIGFDRVIEERGLSLKVQVDDRLPQTIPTDRIRLNQVIKNLVSNAVKFTSKGGITVEIHAPDRDVDLTRSGLHHTQALGISVIDTGIGLPADKQKEIFEAFQQADGSTSRKYGGTGLGLSISREITRLLGGEIHVESEEGKGSTFTVYIQTDLKVDGNGPTADRECSDTGSEITQEQEAKLVKCTGSVVVKDVESQERFPDETALSLHQELDAVSDAARQIVTELHDSDTMLNDKHILLVDDDMRNVFALSKILQDKGAIVYKAANGQKAIEVLESEGDVDLVLMDVMMPIMDGYEAMRAIRANPVYRQLPIMALTAKAMKGDQEKAIEAGANEYMSKPIDMNRLFSLMRNWLYR